VASPSPVDLPLSKARFESFSDGVFAIAITLLILEIHLPAGVTHQSSAADQIRGMIAIWPQYLVYAASFVTIGIMWLNHHALFHSVERITHGIAMWNLVLLGFISFLPFSTYVVGFLDLSTPAVVFYCLTLCAISFGYLAVQRSAMIAHDVSVPMTAWNVVGLSGYPITTLVAFFAPVVAIALAGLLALFYALPRNVSLSRLNRPH
jgi:uncharacterized membrane protein